MTMSMIAQRVFNTPLLVDPVKGHAFLAGLGGRLSEGSLQLPRFDGDAARLERAARVAPRMSILGAELSDRYADRGRRMFSVREGVAIVEMTGSLVHRGDWLGESSGATSYEGLAQQIAAAAADPSVRGIALEIDSFGGQVAGVFDLADAVREARQQKPVWAFVAETALSAAYALASQADRIILPRTGEVGSIGVLIVHADQSQRLSDAGVQITLIHAGAHKVDGNPYAPLPDRVRDALQAEAESLRVLFAETVAAGRGGRMSAQAVLDTQAQVFRGQRALALGLADEVSDMRTAFASFTDHLYRRPRAISPIAAHGRDNQEEPSMTGSTPNAVADDAAQPDTATDPAVKPQTGQTVEAPPEAAPSEPEAQENAQENAQAGEAAQADAAFALLSAKAGPLSRAEAATIAEIGAQAARMGIKVDVAQAIREGLCADALRARVLEEASARDTTSAVFASTPAASLRPKESPVVAAAKRAAAQAAARLTN